MPISRRADYGARLILDLALQPTPEYVPIREAAARHGVPVPFMKKIASQLAAVGLVETTPGPRGGVCLARPAAEITLLDVVEALDGPLFLNLCLVEPRTCPYDQTCPVHLVWAQTQATLTAQLRQTTFAELARQYREKVP
jgi:Rrf2 family protein